MYACVRVCVRGCACACAYVSVWVSSRTKTSSRHWTARLRNNSEAVGIDGQVHTSTREPVGVVDPHSHIHARPWHRPHLSTHAVCPENVANIERAVHLSLDRADARGVDGHVYTCESLRSRWATFKLNSPPPPTHPQTKEPVRVVDPHSHIAPTSPLTPCARNMWPTNNGQYTCH